MADFQFWRRRVYTAASIAKKGIPNPRYDTSDIAQESLLQLLKEFNDEETTYNASYLQKVGQGNAHKLRREHMAQKRSMDTQEKNVALEEIDSQVDDPFQLIQDREGVVNLIKAISRLQPNRQLLIYRRFFDQQTLASIATETGSNISAIRREIETSISELRSILSETDHIS